MEFSQLVYIALVIFLVGTVYRVGTWFWRGIGTAAPQASFLDRVFAAISGVWFTIFSKKFFTLVKVFFVDVIFQWRILKVDSLRWIMHMCIYGGFMLLLIFHALGQFTTAVWFNADFSYLNPWLFLRDLCGVLVIAGVVIAVVRRFVLKAPRFSTSGMDIYAMAIVAVILCSGLVLESVKMTSQAKFTEMVEDWAGMDPDDDEEDIQALTAYWVENYALVSKEVEKPFDAELLEMGADANENNCASCHVSNKWAPAGFVLAKVISPVAGLFDGMGAINFLWWLHTLACLVGLAILPFTKMFHLISTPLSLLANAVMDDETSNPANVATRQVLELSACVHCGTCSKNCSAMMAFHSVGNPYILPSEKIGFLKKLSRKAKLSDEEMRAVSQGIYLCTNCDRCTVTCPSGINLKNLWLSVREDIIQKGPAEPMVLSPLSWFRALNKEKLNGQYEQPQEKALEAVAKDSEKFADKNAPVTLSGTATQVADPTFAACFGCQTCTTVCPVVAMHDDPGADLGLVPHQIMLSLGMGLEDMAAGASMIWECTTCYQCQENCPQEVGIADLLYDLKNLAAKRV